LNINNYFNYNNKYNSNINIIKKLLFPYGYGFFQTVERYTLSTTLIKSLIIDYKNNKIINKNSNNDNNNNNINKMIII